MLTFRKDELLTLVTAVPQDSELLLVHDQGVYIMSMSQPVGKRTIIYAQGCNPEKDTGWWEAARKLVGGDDFGEPFATASEILTLLKSSKYGITIKVTQNNIIVSPR